MKPKRPGFRIEFFRNICNGAGRRVGVPVETIEVFNAKSKKRAEKAAILKLERTQRLESWRNFAHGYRVSELGNRDADKLGTLE
jgi:hypothetical protein